MHIYLSRKFKKLLAFTMLGKYEMHIRQIPRNLEILFYFVFEILDYHRRWILVCFNCYLFEGVERG